MKGIVALLLAVSLVLGVASQIHAEEHVSLTDLTEEDFFALELCDFEYGAGITLHCFNNTGVAISTLIAHDRYEWSYFFESTVAQGGRFGFHYITSGQVGSIWSDDVHKESWKVPRQIADSRWAYGGNCRTVANQVRKCTYEIHFRLITTWTRSTQDLTYAEIRVEWDFGRSDEKWFPEEADPDFYMQTAIAVYNDGRVYAW